jgi:hypothetical protein
MTPRRYERLKKELAANGKLVCTVASGSMLPLLPIGCLIEVAPLRGAAKLFDIVVFLSADRLICHYVVHVNRMKDADPVLITRALAFGIEDMPIRRSAVLGLVVSHRVPARTRIAALLGRFFSALRPR